MSQFGALRHSATRRNLLAIGGIADIVRFSARNTCSDWTQLGHRTVVSTAQLTVSQIGTGQLANGGTPH
jgi:hypothetical protein